MFNCLRVLSGVKQGTDEEVLGRGKRNLGMRREEKGGTGASSVGVSWQRGRGRGGHMLDYEATVRADLKVSGDDQARVARSSMNS